MTKKEAFIIAEMACSHEGNPEPARKIIDGAGKAGADAVQFQIWTPQEMVVPQHPDYEKIKQVELSRKDWSELSAYVRRQYPQMQIIACVYAAASVDFSETIGVDAYKIHSSDLSNPHLIKYVAKTGKRIDLSIGGSTSEEIQKALDWIRTSSQSDIWLMYGIQNFPTPTDRIHLKSIMRLRELFKLPVGYQDHSDGEMPAGFWLSAAAMGLGVEIFEKHITHDRSFRGVDYETALNPDAFGKFVKMLRLVGEAMGSADPRPFSEDEMKYRKYSKKSLVAARDLPAGTRLTEKDLAPLRTGTLGLPPDQMENILGRRLTRDMAAFELIVEESLQ